MKKNPKSFYLPLHPENNKQNVPIALAVLHKTRITAARSYFPNRRDVASFFKIFNTWWAISSSKKRFSPNIPRNFAINEDKKTEFLRALAEWIEETPQTVSALTNTLRVDAVLIGKLLRSPKLRQDFAVSFLN